MRPSQTCWLTLSQRVSPAEAGCAALVLRRIYALLAVVNIRGARSGVRLSATLAVIKIAPLVLLVAVGLFAVHPANLHWMGMPAADDRSAGPRRCSFSPSWASRAR